MPVYVLSKTGHPLMPTYRGGRIRHLLNTGKAKIVRMKPFAELEWVKHSAPEERGQEGEQCENAL